MTKLSPEQQEQFLEDAKTKSNSELAEEYNISVSTVKKLKKGQETAKGSKEPVSEKRIKSLEEKIDSFREAFDEGLDDIFASLEALQKPKDETTDNEKEPKYECGKCKEKFNELINFCPHCGIDLDVTGFQSKNKG